MRRGAKAQVEPGAGYPARDLPLPPESGARGALALRGLALAFAATACACGTPISSEPEIRLGTEDVVPDPLYEDDPGWSFRIAFLGDVVPSAGQLSASVEDAYGLVYGLWDGVIAPEPDGTVVSVSVPMPHVHPDLPAPGPLTIRVWDGETYETSTLRDEAEVTLLARDPIESGGLAGGGPLTRGLPTAIWGVVPRIDPDDPGLVFQGFLDIWTLEAGVEGETVTVSFGDFNGDENVQYADVHLRDAATGAWVAEDTTRDEGKPSVVTLPTDGDYLVYVLHDAAQFEPTAEYRVFWE